MKMSITIIRQNYLEIVVKLTKKNHKRNNAYFKGGEIHWL